MKKFFNFLYHLAGLYCGVSLIFTSYTQWLSNLLDFISEPAMMSGLGSLIWLCLAGTTLSLTSKLIE